jgi:hypothetical protein
VGLIIEPCPEFDDLISVRNRGGDEIIRVSPDGSVKIADDFDQEDAKFAMKTLGELLANSVAN